MNCCQISTILCKYMYMWLFTFKKNTVIPFCDVDTSSLVLFLVSHSHVFLPKYTIAAYTHTFFEWQLQLHKIIKKNIVIIYTDHTSNTAIWISIVRRTTNFIQNL